MKLSYRSLLLFWGCLFCIGSSFLIFGSNLLPYDSTYSSGDILTPSLEGETNEGETNQPPSSYFSQCGFHQEGNSYSMEARCVLQEKLPFLSVKEIVDIIWEDIKSFDEEYLPFESESRYYGGHIIFSSPFPSILDGSFRSTQQLLELAKEDKEIVFTKEELAHYLSRDLSFFVTRKDTSLQGPCNIRNYFLALNRIDKVLLGPGEQYNANTSLSQIRGYCTGRGEANFLFYGGVCGMTAQLFRTALIHPSIEIVQRHPHNEWFVQYYGEQVGGDDAAIYQMSKQFEIKNSGTTDIYFRTKTDENETFLVAISPRSSQWVEIKKETLTDLSAKLERKIWNHQIENEILLLPLSPITPSHFSNQENQLLKEETYMSYYTKKNYERR